MQIMKGIMDSYRKEQPQQFGGLAVIRTRDIKTGIERDRNGKQDKVDLPQSDVIQWRLEDETLLTVRPSGTEPKIKYYILCHGQSGKLPASKEMVQKQIALIEADIRPGIDPHRK